MCHTSKKKPEKMTTYKILQNFRLLKCISSNIQTLKMKYLFSKITTNSVKSENTIDKKHDASRWCITYLRFLASRFFFSRKRFYVREQMTYIDFIYLSWMNYSINSLNKNVFWNVNVYKYCSWFFVFNMLNETRD